jgi:hypothetical protein
MFVGRLIGHVQGAIIKEKRWEIDLKPYSHEDAIYSEI